MTDFLIGGYGADMGGSGTGIAWGRSAPDGTFAFGGTLESLDPAQVSNLKPATDNARAFADETVALLQARPVRREVA